MSVEAVKAVNALAKRGDLNHLTLATRFVLRIIADIHQKETGECYPSIGTLATLTGADRETVKDARATLVGDGFIRLLPRYYPNGKGRKSDGCDLLFMEKGWRYETPGVGVTDPQGGGERPRGWRSDASRTGTERVLNGEANGAEAEPPATDPASPESDGNATPEFDGSRANNTDSPGARACEGCGKPTYGDGCPNPACSEVVS
jgi:hypothetical protein